ncbi:acyltransferase-like protein [Mucilaginibacter yixingensis]|uniref:Acyltransferase-like protein n=2 Tax=Mucilaginibacter yixingensis TaxID=1295612 RepID=A0A2T5JE55_9SPHI|nr:acyltransferase-like protein [Mucilaginibacter yixingensis]
MIPQRRVPFIQDMFQRYVTYRLRRTFNVMEFNKIDIKPNHSILLLPNHFSWWDGFLAFWLEGKFFDRNFYIMMQEDHLQKRMFFNLTGGFSINPQSKEMITSLNYASNLLSDPTNLVTIFPQGALISNHAEQITVQPGIGHVIKKIKGDCQIVYYTVLVEYFESLKPSLYFHLLDCGTNHDFNFERMKEQINTHHRTVLQNQINVAH